MSRRCRPARQTVGTLRRSHCLLELSKVQVHQARNHRHFVSAARLQRRTYRKENQTRQSLLWLFRVSEMRNGLLGQTRRRKVSAVRRAFSFGEDNQERRNALLRERTMWLSWRAS